MKKILFFLSGTFISFSSFTQNQKPFDPCCGIISIKAIPGAPCCNVITVRDKTTGELHSLKTTKSESSSLKIGETVSVRIQNKKATVIDGGTTTVDIVQPSSFAPCCNIVSIKVDPLEPPNGNRIVTAKLNGTSETFNFFVPKTISSLLHVGQEVAREDNYAFIRPTNKTMYSYSINGNEDKTDLSNASTGKVHLDLPKDDQCFIFIYEHGTNKEIKGTSKDRIFYMAPGVYDIKVSSVKMEEITVMKGMDTKILAGSLNITSPSSWQLFDESKKIRITGSSKPGKIGLPVGNYNVKINGSFLPIVIKDGEMVNL